MNKQKKTLGGKGRSTATDESGPFEATREEVESALTRRDARIEIRLRREEKESVERMARRYGLTVTDYVLRLHRLARRRIEG